MNKAKRILNNRILNPLVLHAYRTGKRRLAYRLERSKLYNPPHLLGGEKTQWCPPDQMEKLQQKKLQVILSHAYENVPYYHRIFKERNLKPEDIKSTEDLSKLPILTKDVIRRDFNDLIAKNATKEDLIFNSTSGSTGEPLKFYMDRSLQEHQMMGKYRAWSWRGISPTEKRADIFGGLDAEEKKSAPNKLWISVFNLSEDTIRYYVDKMVEFQPGFIRGFPSALHLIARYMLKEGIDKVRPIAVTTTAEALFEYQRREIANAFDCEVFDHYGAREHAVGSFECPEHFGYHISGDNGVLEFIKGGENVSAGEEGAIVVTDFTHFSMPFIRYKIGDVGVPSDEICPCGRGLPVMESVIGRISDVVVTPQNKYISGSVLSHIFKNLNIEEFMILQETKKDFTIKIVKGGNYSSNDSEYIHTSFKKYIDPDINVNIEFVDSIPTTKAGKRCFVKSEVPKFL